MIAENTINLSQMWRRGNPMLSNGEHWETIEDIFDSMSLASMLEGDFLLEWDLKRQLFEVVYRNEDGLPDFSLHLITDLLKGNYNYMKGLLLIMFVNAYIRCLTSKPEAVNVNPWFLAWERLGFPHPELAERDVWETLPCSRGVYIGRPGVGWPFEDNYTLVADGWYTRINRIDQPPLWTGRVGLSDGPISTRLNIRALHDCRIMLDPLSYRSREAIWRWAKALNR